MEKLISQAQWAKDRHRYLGKSPKRDGHGLIEDPFRVIYEKLLAWCKNRLDRAFSYGSTAILDYEGTGHIDTSFLAVELVEKSGYFQRDVLWVLDDPQHILWDAVTDATAWYEERWEE